MSQGCIRLRDDDIKLLFDNVPVGTRVQLIDQPVKTTLEPDGTRWLEVHEPLSRNRTEFESDKRVPITLTGALRKEVESPDADAQVVSEAIERRSGMPVQINHAVGTTF